MPKIEVKNLSITLGGRKILKDVSFTVKGGQSYVILGPSGCGKSVLIKSIIGLLQPDKGSEVTIGKHTFRCEKISKRKTFLEDFGMLFQACALFDSMTIWENISFQSRSCHKLSVSDAQELAREKLKLVGLGADVLFKYPKELSGGMQKRAALARAVANEPKIIFFDEPTTGLDPINASNISHFIREFSKETGATIISVTHDMNCTNTIADKIGMLKDGELIWEGSSLYNIKNPYVKKFVNSAAL